MREIKRLVFLAIALGMLLYAVPRLEVGADWTAQSVFAAVWIGFALLFVAAQLHFILGVDQEMRQELQRVKQEKRRQLERAFAGQGLFPGRK